MPRRASHITTGSVLDELGFTPAELAELKIKMELWQSLVAHIGALQLTQQELATQLGVHQPDVSNLLKGKLSRFGVDTFVKYAVRLGLVVEWKLIKPASRCTTPVKAVAANATAVRRPARVAAQQMMAAGA